ncbi:MAG: hypothetical protein P8Q36_09595 [Alphaproteobacteria bacterium]|jgi:tetratricopeptide (TPR) repeat protein|nr:hypothetical protein [Rhodospirillaceae bacterium]MDG2481103.1 hypothetical protein [Alphaproteobacteria bacterium]MBT6205683.1 hypothetical protein [Rhodospirillaceae bacterium]MBT6510771.1 hypothetical protein [Rhodospirillaceae bacterium]MBT7615228.1 hypothetical protein [Rhodospirillaceae bacterium]
MIRYLAVLCLCFLYAGRLAAQDGSSLMAKAEEAYFAGRTSEAMELADEALGIGGLTQLEQGKAYAYRGNGLLMSGKLQEAFDDFDAIDDLEDAVVAAENRGLMSAALAAVMTDAGEEEEAQELLREAAQAPVPAIRELASLDVLAALGGDRDRSLELFCIAAMINPRDGELLGAMLTSGMTAESCQ